MKLSKLLFTTLAAGLALAATAGCQGRSGGEGEQSATATQERQQPSDQREQALEQRQEAVEQQQEAIDQQQQARQELEEARQQEQQAQQELQQARQQEQQAMQQQEQTLQQQQQARQQVQQQDQQQDQQQQAQMRQQDQQAQQQPAGGAVPTQQQAQAGQIQGTVENIDVPGGKLTVRSGEQTITLHAVPTVLGQYKQGDTATLRYESFGGENWISQQAGGGPSASLADKYSMAGTVTGTISELDRNAGVIVVRGTEYAAHPDQLENLSPGQFVSLSYANVEGKNWVADIQQQAGEQPGGAQQPPQQMQQPGEQQLPPSQREMEQPEQP